MARLGEVPFRRYYGSVDATPLFVMLADLYLKRSAISTRSVPSWPNLLAALGADRHPWRSRRRRLRRISAHDRARPRQPGLEGQLRFDLPCRRHSGRRADRLVRGAGLCLRRQARRRGSRAGSAGKIALPGSNAKPRPCGSVSRIASGSTSSAAMRWRSTAASSRAGCFRPMPAMPVAGIAAPEQAASLAQLLTGRSFFSGWGVRTIAAEAGRYLQSDVLP